MNNFLNMDFTQEELNESQKDEYALIPKGDYTAEIVHSEIKDFHWKNSGAFGNLLSLRFRIVEGEFAGRVVFADAQLANSEYPSFVEQGRKLLAQIALACNIKQLNDSTQLHDKEMTIQLVVEKSKDPQYDDKNVVKKVVPLKGGQPSKFTAKPFNVSEPTTATATSHAEQVKNAGNAAQPDTSVPAWQRG
jgi:hypothetical protein